MLPLEACQSDFCTGLQLVQLLEDICLELLLSLLNLFSYFTQLVVHGCAMCVNLFHDLFTYLLGLHCKCLTTLQTTCLSNSNNVSCNVRSTARH